MDAKKCALIRQTWYEAAKRNMKDGARLAFYEACFEYEFYGQEPEATLFDFSDAMLMFDMVKDALLADSVKAENIALRNRRNGMLGGRPRKSDEVVNSDKPKETQENPENPSGYFGVSTTLHNTTLQDPDKSVSMAKARKRRHKDIDKYDYFRVMFVFFYSGAVDPAAEADKFYNYYKARDWQVGRGQTVKDKVALAKTWEIKDSNPGLISARKMYSALIECLDPEEPELLTDFVAMLKDDQKKHVIIRMCNGNRLMSILEQRYLSLLQMYMLNRLQLDGYQLIYESM